MSLTGKVPKGYNKIKVHFIFDIKYNRRHKARLITSEHLTHIPLSSVYSDLVSLRYIWLVLFLAELNKLDS